MWKLYDTRLALNAIGKAQRAYYLVRNQGAWVPRSEVLVHCIHDVWICATMRYSGRRVQVRCAQAWVQSTPRLMS